jgi:hypothetical protein
MTTEDLKKEIHHLIDIIPENVLEEVYGYLHTVQQHPEKLKDTSILKKILAEDKELLEKLAK